jgi:hypothetical protein
MTADERARIGSRLTVQFRRDTGEGRVSRETPLGTVTWTVER